MLHSQFPDINWLKKMIQERELSGKGWPTCILNVNTQQAYRPEVRGPLSLFINLDGQSHCQVGNHKVTVDADSYFLSNSGDHYDFEIDADTPTETFNIHIEQRLMDQVFAGLNASDGQLLDQPDRKASQAWNFFPQLYAKDPFMVGLIQEIKSQHQAIGYQQMLETEQISRLLTHLLEVHGGCIRQMEGLSALRKSTREETYRRLILAKDYIHSCFRSDLDLESLAQVACMSRFHFLRAFKQTFGCTPYQYLKRLRMEKAADLLSQTSVPIQSIGFELGYENLSSFSRVFRQSFGVAPLAYRETHTPEKFAILVNS